MYFDDVCELLSCDVCDVPVYETVGIMKMIEVMEDFKISTN